MGAIEADEAMRRIQFKPHFFNLAAQAERG
jgi:hypothetical protein